MHVRPEVGRIPIGTFGKWFSLCIQTDRPSSLLDLLHEIFGNAFTSSIKFQLCLKEEGGEGASLCFVSVFGKILSQHWEPELSQRQGGGEAEPKCTKMQSDIKAIQGRTFPYCKSNLDCSEILED